MKNFKNNYKNIKFRILPISNTKQIEILWARAKKLELNKINKDQNKYHKPINISYKNSKYIKN